MGDLRINPRIVARREYRSIPLATLAGAQSAVSALPPVVMATARGGSRNGQSTTDPPTGGQGCLDCDPASRPRPGRWDSLIERLTRRRGASASIAKADQDFVVAVERYNKVRIATRRPQVKCEDFVDIKHETGHFLGDELRRRR